MKTPILKTNSAQGFTLLLALLVTGVFLSIATAIFNITIKQITLSSLGRDSQLAFYAADAGIECALYWNYQYKTVEPTDDDGSAFNSHMVSGINDAAKNDQAFCNGQDIVKKDAPLDTAVLPGSADDGFEFPSVNSNPAETIFWFSLGVADTAPCVKVVVTKNESPPGSDSTTILARGYNNCNASFRQVERAIEVTL